MDLKVSDPWEHRKSEQKEDEENYWIIFIISVVPPNLT